MNAEKATKTFSLKGKRFLSLLNIVLSLLGNHQKKAVLKSQLLVSKLFFVSPRQFINSP